MSQGAYKLNVEKRCRMCERPGRVRPLTRHHVVPQWWYRDQVARGLIRPHLYQRANRNDNVVPLCRPCHDLIDHGPWHERRRYRAMLRRLLTPAEVANARRVIGRAWLDREYPLRQADVSGRLSETA